MNSEISTLKNYFKSKQVPQQIKLDVGTNITNVPLFIDSHLQVIENAQNDKMAKPFVDRLLKLQELLGE